MTKYMVVGKNKTCNTFYNTDDFKFERVRSFIYLGSLINDTSDVTEEINRRIQNANRSYYGLQKFFISRLLTHEIK